MTTQDAVTVLSVALACAGGACAAWQSARVEAMRRRLKRADDALTDARQWQAGWAGFVMRNGMPIELDYAQREMTEADRALHPEAHRRP